jgi:hypothetical protein
MQPRPPAAKSRGAPGPSTPISRRRIPLPPPPPRPSAAAGTSPCRRRRAPVPPCRRAADIRRGHICACPSHIRVGSPPDAGGRDRRVGPWGRPILSRGPSVGPGRAGPGRAGRFDGRRRDLLKETEKERERESERVRESKCEREREQMREGERGREGEREREQKRGRDSTLPANC